ncbi:hypothetical protein [Cellulomonas oligotrophica]|uniref:Uncharacterized protein n=1 Tax=Cellulomonas oligotrophica TaxID=931536 RepID=A0ABQ4D8X4_9CELL|nr:hypothetical protein [Cellulomonas oligotrophica]GIG32171.1 hypothetical protein Col01nite_13300 [Cellulomonas oligotrophica]
MLAGVLALVLAGGATAAYAGTASSSTGYFSANGVSYLNFAWINTNPTDHYAVASTRTQKNGSGSLAAGWGGARGRLFTSGGTLRCEGTNQYNPSGTTTVAGSSCLLNATGAWYSYGVSLGWNGSGYNSVYTFISPNQNS